MKRQILQGHSVAESGLKGIDYVNSTLHSRIVVPVCGHLLHPSSSGSSSKFYF